MRSHIVVVSLCSFVVALLVRFVFGRLVRFRSCAFALLVPFGFAGSRWFCCCVFGFDDVLPGFVGMGLVWCCDLMLLDCVHVVGVIAFLVVCFCFVGLISFCCCALSWLRWFVSLCWSTFLCFGLLMFVVFG